MSARGGSRMDGPLLEGPSNETTEAQELLRWMKVEGLVTQDGAGYAKLRTKGQQVLAALQTIEQIERSRPS